MPLTNSLVAICDFLIESLNNTKSQTGIQAVHYGDQELIETTPVACIEPISKVFLPRQSAGSRMQDLEFNVAVIIYNSLITSTDVNRREADIVTEAVETVINSDRQMTRGGQDQLVIHCWSTGYDSGYSSKGGTRLRSSKINFYAKSQFLLPG